MPIRPILFRRLRGNAQKNAGGQRTGYGGGEIRGELPAEFAHSDKFPLRDSPDQLVHKQRRRNQHHAFAKPRHLWRHLNQFRLLRFLKFFAPRQFAFHCAALLRSDFANCLIVSTVIARVFGSPNSVMPATPPAPASRHSFTCSRQIPPSAIKGNEANSCAASDSFPRPTGGPYFSFDGDGKIGPKTAKSASCRQASRASGKECVEAPTRNFAPNVSLITSGVIERVVR